MPSSFSFCQQEAIRRQLGMFNLSMNVILAAKAVLVLYGTLVSPHLYTTSSDVISRYFFIVIVSIVVFSEYKIFRVIYSQGGKYRISSLLFILLIPVAFLVGIDWEYHKYMMLIILVFGFYVYKLDFSFLKKRSTDKA